ncbi:MerR family transcriptional regulator [Pseudonocardia abyssalis]|uniref:MerR family transcriptional regulator n=1 Tax=Pseudonocardia abyssalis TaxID=2792008 RepID=A0ABS6USS8_9PSEU|nr:MerR family transcriptional regulator [Pseudonocardia abyssalis]MBW0116130.1 MerR family transcriptional regulator [Pseudonocardia abyssalis]MBW0135011.1 MerR family transcriptional regulator [Pseudonocardia abyssalis]
MTGALRSGQLAAAAGVSVQTLRYYERRGLLPDPQRSLGGHREYGPDALRVLRTIKAVQQLGFTLDEITDLLDLGSHRGPRPGLRAAARAKLADVDTKIADLTAVRATLLDVLDAGCTDLDTCSCAASCPIPFRALAHPVDVPISASTVPAQGPATGRRARR